MLQSMVVTTIASRKGCYELLSVAYDQGFFGCFGGSMFWNARSNFSHARRDVRADPGDRCFIMGDHDRHAATHGRVRNPELATRDYTDRSLGKRY